MQNREINQIANGVTSGSSSISLDAIDNFSNSDINSSTQPIIPSITSISLPKDGGAIRRIGEKFSVNSATATGTINVPIFTSPRRSGFGPQLFLSYVSGAGNRP